MRTTLIMATAILAATGCSGDMLEMLGTGSWAACSTTFGCGDNSGYLNQYPLSELEETGAEMSQDRFRIVGAEEASGTPFALEVANGHFYGHFANGNVKGAAELYGSRVVVKHDSGEMFAIVIGEVSGEVSWANPGSTLPAYQLSYFDVPQLPLNPRENPPTTPVCHNTGGGQTLALLVAGERYDKESLRVLEPAGSPGAQGWFNIACSGSALAKMKLMSHDPEIAGTYVTTAEQRQAALKMITADYCGTGESFTVSGTPLHWQNRAGWCAAGTCSYAPQSTDAHEAIWNAEGAVCLDRPRLVDRAEVEAACPWIPDCDGYSIGDGEWETFLP